MDRFYSDLLLEYFLLTGVIEIEIEIVFLLNRYMLIFILLQTVDWWVGWFMEYQVIKPICSRTKLNKTQYQPVKPIETQLLVCISLFHDGRFVGELLGLAMSLFL